MKKEKEYIFICSKCGKKVICYIKSSIVRCNNCSCNMVCEEILKIKEQKDKNV